MPLSGKFKFKNFACLASGFVHWLGTRLPLFAFRSTCNNTNSSRNNVSINKKAIEQLFPELAEALSQNGIYDITVDSASQMTLKNIKDGFNIEHISSIEIDNIGKLEFKSSVFTNQKLFSEMVALEKSLPPIGDSQTIYLNQLLNLLDMTFLHKYNVTIEDDGLLDIVHSFIKTNLPLLAK